MSESIKHFEGAYGAPADARFAVVSARFNEFIVDRLVEGAVGTLERNGVARTQIATVRAPGAFELPMLCARLAKGGHFDAVIVLGCVIRGATAHFDFVAGEAAKGCGSAAVDSGVPVIFGVLTTDTIEQAIERAGTKAGNKGSESALSALEMVNLLRGLTAAGI